MSSEISRYIASLQEKITSLADGNTQALDAAAELCADALAARQVIHIYDTGHLISHELIMRTGGLAAYAHLSFEGALDNRNLWRQLHPGAAPTPEEKLEIEQALIKWLFGQGTLHKGDVLIIGSVSGLGIRLVELALQAQEHELHVIAVTSVGFSSQLVSKHPSGKRLYEAAEVVLDNQAEYGDSFFNLPGVERKICPSSGIAAAILMWSLTVGIAERLVERGLQPSIFASVNLPNGPALVEETEKAYRERGF